MLGLGNNLTKYKFNNINITEILIKNFKIRVLIDGGVFEAESCLLTTLTQLNLQYPPLLITAPIITGSVAIGSVMSVSNGVFNGVTPLTYTYQWMLNGNPILGATSSTYTTENLGTISCKVTATNSFGSANSTSNSLEVTPLLLDTYTNSSVAYSLRKLRTGYTGSAIRVRRASDNLETNIGFINNKLDTATLETFCSGTNGFVTTIYDQKGSNNFIQTNALRQGIIVISGVVNLENGKPIIYRSTDANGGYLASSLNFVADTNIYGSYSVFKRPISGDFGLFGSNSGGNDYGFIASNGSTSPFINNLVIPSQQKLNNVTPTFTTRGEIYSAFENQFLFSLGIQFNYANSGYSLGYRYANPSTFGMVQFQEHILFSNLSNRTKIEANINSYYNIY